MDKLALIEDYINRCDSFIGSNNKVNTKLLVREIIAVFHSEIKDIEFTLASYYDGSDASYEKDLTALKPILVNYRANIKREEDMRKVELEKLKLQQSILTINNTNSNESKSTSIAILESTITAQYAIENINRLPEDSITNDDKEILEGKIAALDMATTTQNKEKIIEKLGSVMKYIIDKGIDVGIAVLPYIGEIAKKVQSM